VAPKISLTGRIVLSEGTITLDERALPGRQPRLAFAMLVAEPHRTVRRGDLADELWPDARPETWETALRVVVSRVRAFLAAAGLDDRDVLRAAAGAYHLDLPQGTEVDLDCAAEQVRMADAALAARDAMLAGALTAEARVVLARPLLPGVESPWVDSRRAEQSSLLLHALEVLAETRLMLGEHGHAAAAAEHAIALDPFRESGHRFLIRALADGGNGGAALRAYEACRGLLAEELGVEPSPDTQALHLAILRAAPPAVPPGPLPPSLAAPAEDCPYLGLQTFEESHASLFFGREADVSRLLDRLGDTRFLAVLGPSGSGKSSLVRAGLVPALRRGALAGSDTWALRVLRPGAVPIKALVRELAELDPGLDQAEAAERLMRDAGALHDTVEAALRGGQAAERMLIVVDQLEEVFTLCDEGEPREAFLSALAAAAAAPSGHTMVIVALRADFYPRLADHPRLADLASAHQLLVTPMDEVGLSEAVEGPARIARLRLEQGLTQTILRDVARRPGALPLLGHALLELWEGRTDGTLTLEAYQTAGGVEGALAQRADAVYSALPPAQQTVARSVLLRLTQPGQGILDSRRRVQFDELPTGPEQRGIVEAVIGTLTAARLVTTGGPPEDGRWVEISHEALIRGWPLLRQWVEEDRAGLLVHRRLTEAATEWERLGGDEGTLYRGGRLAEATAWAERHPGAVNPLERDFAAASLRVQESERRHRLRRLRLTATGLGVGLALVASLTLVASGEARQRAEQVRITTARQLAAAADANLGVDPERSILLALEGVDATRSVDGTVVPEAEEALHRAVKTSRLVRTVPQGGHGLAVTSDGTRFVTGGSDPTHNTATIWDTETAEPLLTITGPEVGPMALAFSADDRLLASTHDDGTARIWVAETGEEGAVLPVREPFLTHPAFSPDSRWVATSGQGRTVRIWDVAEGEEVMTLTGRTERTSGPVFHPDGSRLASAGIDATVTIWDLSSGETAVTLTGHEWPVTQAAFSPDGTSIATASNDASARIWDAASGAHLLTLFNPTPVNAVAFSRDGARIATGGSDGSARVWDAGTGRELLALPGHGADIARVAFTPEGDRLLTASLDGTTRIWDVSVAGARDWLTVPGAAQIYSGVAFSPDGARFAAPAEPSGLTIWDTATGAEVISLAGHGVKLTTVAFSPDGRRIIGGSDLTRSPPVWDAESGELLFELAGHGDEVRAVAFSPDGRRLVTGDWGGTIRLWDASTGRRQGVLHPTGAPVAAVAFSTDGRRIVAGLASGAVALWDAGTLEEVTTLSGHANMVFGLDVGPDGVLATASLDGTAKIWDVDTGEEVTTLGHDAPVNQVALSPDGTQAATGSDDRTVKLWDLESGRVLLTLHGHDYLVYGVAFSPDGRLLASASPDGTVALHLLPVDAFVELARERVTRGLTDEECRQYLHLMRCPQG
jgi:WD40 repeat protein/DNA-binding SARP family transcriptional activator